MIKRDSFIDNYRYQSMLEEITTQNVHRGTLDLGVNYNLVTAIFSNFKDGSKVIIRGKAEVDLLSKRGFRSVIGYFNNEDCLLSSSFGKFIRNEDNMLYLCESTRKIPQQFQKKVEKIMKSNSHYKLKRLLEMDCNQNKLFLPEQDESALALHCWHNNPPKRQ